MIHDNFIPRVGAPEIVGKIDVALLKTRYEEQLMKGGDLRPIDFNEYAVACMKVEDGKLIDNIYLYTGFGGFPEALYDMNVTFEQYLELAYKAKCFNYWNLTYCLKEKSPGYELMKRFFPVIFPHLEADLADFGINY